MNEHPPSPPPPPPPPAAGGWASWDGTGSASSGQPEGWGGGGPVTVRPGDEIPRPGLDGRERELAPAVVTSWRISAGLSWLLPGVVAIGLGVALGSPWVWLILGCLLAVVLFSVIAYPPMRFRRWRWQLTDLAVELRYGVLVHRKETVPYFRIQQIDIAAGPVDRLLELASLQVTTASASGSATLPGIAAQDAPRVRAELLARAAAAVADHPGDLRDAV